MKGSFDLTLFVETLSIMSEKIISKFMITGYAYSLRGSIIGPRRC